MNTLPTITLDQCVWDRQHNRLVISSTVFTGGFPRQFFVHSPRTGMTVRFGTIGPEDRLYDHDGWDGEQAIYRPIGVVPRIDHAVVTHMF